MKERVGDESPNLPFIDFSRVEREPIRDESLSPPTFDHVLQELLQLLRVLGRINRAGIWGLVTI